MPHFPTRARASRANSSDIAFMRASASAHVCAQMTRSDLLPAIRESIANHTRGRESRSNPYHSSRATRTLHENPGMTSSAVNVSVSA